jgi:hypothetical protein
MGRENLGHVAQKDSKFLFKIQKEKSLDDQDENLKG